MTHQARWDGVSCVGGPTGGGSVKGAGRFVRLARGAGRALLHRVRREQLVIGGVPIKSAAGSCTSSISRTMLPVSLSGGMRYTPQPASEACRLESNGAASMITWAWAAELSAALSAECKCLPCCPKA